MAAVLAAAAAAAQETPAQKAPSGELAMSMAALAAPRRMSRPRWVADAKVDANGRRRNQWLRSSAKCNQRPARWAQTRSMVADAYLMEELRRTAEASAWKEQLSYGCRVDCAAHSLVSSINSVRLHSDGCGRRSDEERKRSVCSPRH